MHLYSLEALIPQTKRKNKVTTVRSRFFFLKLISFYKKWNFRKFTHAVKVGKVRMMQYYYVVFSLSWFIRWTMARASAMPIRRLLWIQLFVPGWCGHHRALKEPFVSFEQTGVLPRSAGLSVFPGLNKRNDPGTSLCAPHSASKYNLVPVKNSTGALALQGLQCSVVNNDFRRRESRL